MSGIEGMPEITPEDRALGERALKNYIFVTNESDGSKTCYCTACRKKFIEMIPRRTYSNEDEMLFGAKHRTKAPCPKCHRESEVINRGRLKNLKRLNDRLCFAFFKVISVDEIWLLCYIFDRYFYDASVKDDVLEYEAYHFSKGQKTRYFRLGWYSLDMAEIGKIREPFGYFNSCAGFIYDPYTLIGDGELESTFFRYSRFKEWMNADRFVHYLDAFAEFPRVIEMLEKQGFGNLVNEKVLRGRMCSEVCRFRATDPKRFWLLDKREREIWRMSYHEDLLLAKTYRRLFRQDGAEKGMREAYVWNSFFAYGNEKEMIEMLDRYGHTVQEAAAFIEKKRHYYTTSRHVWKDYLEAAEAIGLDLTVHNVFFPRDLQAAHDNAVALRKVELDKIAEAGAKKRRAEIDKTYGFKLGDYLIRAPKGAKEIIEEGKSLRHCVGGYADRHARGETTILFMRAAAEPSKPLYTIEIRGKTLIQAHGYQNIKNPEDVPEAQAFLDEWLAWVQAGSKRGKDGKPIVKVKNGQKAGKQKGQAA